ncbi:MAG: glycosyltransferase [Candidatus Latescibacteria bacterium]|nr:glycosyltransferase [Candidatus Latescibacterota bacterium]NIM21155.1 glycosyltransferase [Candidatus Latescibacterota bacterium]NIM65290.1 glycosyltransferase [Candidatus Latescibacterota bacterium]NIO01805.1 glycosyltransferase [Candidatus Latescibacterota bacterium]NIO28322.1 glycosyltransferase [Candidatus Latescibacterota bacterium]
MFPAADKMQRFRGIAFVGNYLPRVCGIATFATDLAEAIAQQAGANQPVIAMAMNDTLDGYAYPDMVKFEVRQDYQIDYSRAADFLNFSRIDLVCLQHEYGIFGGEWGSNVLTLLRDLHRPLVVTCHTVVKEADPVQREVFIEIAACADKLVVMSERAFELLETVYRVPRERIVHIPHGIHDVPFIDPSYYKDKFGVEGRQVLLTFGLLHKYKGIEYMIEALPTVVENHPKTIYLVLGATHPTVVAEEGEAYRLKLQRRVRELSLQENVLFHPRFVDLDELLEYLGAADICVMPYLRREQITSGALAYAMGSGKAVVSTPFWHAEELLADGRGQLVPMRDTESLAEAILGLLDDEVKASTMRKKAYTYCRRMVWPVVARAYLELFDEVRSHVAQVVPTASAMRRPIAATNLPLPSLDHLIRLSDDTGPSHHSLHTVPDWRYGYKLEDAAIALVASSKFFDMFGDEKALGLAQTYLALIQILIGDGSDIAEGLDYTRRRIREASEVSVGMSVWALGYMVGNGPSLLVAAANDLFQQLKQNAALSDPRGVGYAILGAASYLKRFPGASAVRRFLASHADKLEVFCGEQGWIDRWNSPDWPVAAQALIMASSILGNERMRSRAKSMIVEMREVTHNGKLFLSPGKNIEEEELPTSAATFIEALGAALQIERDPDLLIPIRAAADWFLGSNRKGESLYDFATGGCHDAITASGLNLNQGTEATVFCLIAFITLHRLAATQAASEKMDPTSL